jgi:FtsZ-interacting cell division protein ZipA
MAYFIIIVIIIIIIIIIIILLETVGLRVPNRNFSDFKLFRVDLNRRNCTSDRCVSAANAISRILVYSSVGLF